MLFMNECEIEAAVQRYQGRGVLGQAAQALEKFKDLVNASSDGWPYWSPAPRAAKKLMELIQIKSFCTKHQLKLTL